MRFLLTMILLTICVSCRSVLRINCQMNNDKKYVDNVPVLFEIDGDFVYKETWDSKDGIKMELNPNFFDSWERASFCTDINIRQEVIFNFHSWEDPNKLVCQISTKGHYSPGNIYYYDLKFINLDWKTDPNNKGKVSLNWNCESKCQYMFRFVIPDNETNSLIKDSYEFNYKTLEDEKLVYIKGKMPELTANQLVLI